MLAEPVIPQVGQAYLEQLIILQVTFFPFQLQQGGECLVKVLKNKESSA